MKHSAQAEFEFQVHFKRRVTADSQGGQTNQRRREPAVSRDPPGQRFGPEVGQVVLKTDATRMRARTLQRIELNNLRDPSTSSNALAS